jgi:hypothetical protein
MEWVRWIINATPTLPNDGVVTFFFVDQKIYKMKQLVMIFICATEVYSPRGSAVHFVSVETFILSWYKFNLFIRILALAATKK